jgi:hypothetical protein
MKVPQVPALPGMTPLGLKPKKRSAKAEKKLAEDRVTRAYTVGCSGIQVSILDTPKIFAHGLARVAAGDTDAALVANIRLFVDTIRRN